MATLGRRLAAGRSRRALHPAARPPTPATVLNEGAVTGPVAAWSGLVMVTPPGGDRHCPNPIVLAAAHLAGWEEVYRVGGAPGRSRPGLRNRVDSCR